MIKKRLTFAAIQITAILISAFILGFALAGSHGNLHFSNVGGTVAIIVTIILSIPLFYLLIERRNFQKKKFLFIFGILIFCLSITAIYVGLPTVTKKFIIDKDYINNVLISNDGNLRVNLQLQPEMFNRVGIKANIDKINAIEIEKFDLTIYGNNGEIIKPVFPPLAWNLRSSEMIQMNSFFEINDYSKLKQFALTAQYSIEDLDSLKMNIDYAFTKNGQTISNKKQIGVRITNHLIWEKIIEY